MYEELVKNLRSVEGTWQTQEEEWMLQAADAIEKLIALTAVPQEMSADVYLWQRERMCHSFDKATYDPRIDQCEDCPLIDCCSKRGCLEDAEAVDIVDAWAQEHPERSEE